MQNLGPKIREERKKAGLTQKQLAKRIGISPITLQRIETGKSSPSVATLSEIVHHLNKSIVSFFQEIDRPLIHVKGKDQKSISTPSLKIKVIAPKNMIRNDIIVTYGELKKGKRIDPHSNQGVEFAYILEGKCEHRQNNQSIILKKGDSLSYNARIKHEIIALEKLKFVAIYIKD